MAKKQAPTNPEAVEKATAPAAEVVSESPAKKEKKPREAKAKEPKEPKGKKTSPAAPAAAPEAAAPPAAATAPAGAGKAAPAEAPTSKRKKAPGIAPSLGKKLKNHLRNLRQKIAKDGPTPVKRAVSLLKSLKRSKFDETVEVHMALGIDATQNDQMVRGSVSLPFGIGKAVRVLVFCQGDNVAKAKEAGADYAGSDEFIKKIQQESWLEFDIALATQDMMGMVSRLGKILGPRGLMPTPKAGTVITGDVAQGVREFKAGKVEYRTDKGGNVHAGVGKMSFDEDKLVGNITAFVDQVRSVKPAGVKGNYVKSITLSATMSPGIPIIV